jgi:hypothetical protein
MVKSNYRILINAKNYKSLKKFSIQDPMNLFEISSIFSQCDSKNCSQSIVLKKKLTMLTQFSMEIQFIQQFKDGSEIALTALIDVIIKKPTRSLDYFPKFSKSAYEFIIDEDIKPNTIARNVSILVQNEYQTDFSSGFGLELLNIDLTPANTDTFELVPNYGVGFLVASLKVKCVLDYEKGNRKYDFVIKSSSWSKKMISYANLTIWIKDTNEFNPYFEKTLYSIIVNDPEKLKANDIITQLRAVDEDGDGTNEGLVYSVVGPYQKKFQVNKRGEVRLMSRFDLTDPTTRPFYNLTVAVVDQGGLNDLTNLVIYLNTSFPFMQLQSSMVFSCANSGARSELNKFDKRTLSPDLYVLVRRVLMINFQPDTRF